MKEILECYIEVLKDFKIFNGRTRRKVYWSFILVHFMILILLSVLSILKLSVVSNLYSLVVMVPAIAAGIRRMHDVGKSGWFLLIPVYSLVLVLKPGTQGQNKYGIDPKA